MLTVKKICFFRKDYLPTLSKTINNFLLKSPHVGLSLGQKRIFSSNRHDVLFTFLLDQVCLTPVPAGEFLKHADCRLWGDGLRREFSALGEWGTKREAALKAQAGGGDVDMCCEYFYDKS